MLFYYDDAFLEHDTGRHPECADRLRAIMRAVDGSPLAAELDRRKPRRASPEEIALVHAPAYIDSIRRVALAGGGHLDPDTVTSRGSWEAALAAVGAGLDAADALAAGEARRAFLAVRPPGHHALPARAMGFCLFNNIAIVARYLRERHGVGRILIYDFDCHHGNGTQAIFEDDADVFYLSLHRYPFYPGTGGASERGRGAGEGATLNIPLGWGAGSEEVVREAIEAVAEVAHETRPEFVLVSAGFDGYANDPIAGMGLEARHFAELTRAAVDAAEVAAGGRVISTLEGGYNLDALGECAVAHLMALAPERGTQSTENR